jgi:hypothetical protein
MNVNRTTFALIAFAALIACSATRSAVAMQEEVSSERPVVQYCLTERLRNYDREYNCTWSRSWTMACEGGMGSASIKKIYIAEINQTFQQCPGSGKWLTKITMVE